MVTYRYIIIALISTWFTPALCQAGGLTTQKEISILKSMPFEKIPTTSTVSAEIHHLVQPIIDAGAKCSLAVPLYKQLSDIYLGELANDSTVTSQIDSTATRELLATFTLKSVEVLLELSRAGTPDTIQTTAPNTMAEDIFVKVSDGTVISTAPIISMSPAMKEDYYNDLVSTRWWLVNRLALLLSRQPALLETLRTSAAATTDEGTIRWAGEIDRLARNPELIDTSLEHRKYLEP